MRLPAPSSLCSLGYAWSAKVSKNQQKVEVKNVKKGLVSCRNTPSPRGNQVGAEAKYGDGWKRDADSGRRAWLQICPKTPATIPQVLF